MVRQQQVQLRYFQYLVVWQEQLLLDGESLVWLNVSKENVRTLEKLSSINNSLLSLRTINNLILQSLDLISLSDNVASH